MIAETEAEYETAKRLTEEAAARGDRVFISKRYNIWSCSSGMNWAEMVMGFGRDPESAFKDWERQAPRVGRFV